MHLLIPDTFFIPVYYSEKNILNIENSITLQGSNSCNKYLKRRDIVIGVSFPTLKENRWVRDKEAMEKYAKNKGITLKIEFNDLDESKQISQVENLISEGIDVLILSPLNLLTSKELADKAHKAGIKVISYEGLIKNSSIDLLVAFDYSKIGELQGKFLIDNVPKGNYIIMYLDTFEPELGLKAGAMKYITPLVNIRNIKIIADKPVKLSNPTHAYDIVKDALIANKNKVDAILAPNDSMAAAAIEALKEQGLAGKVSITGQNALLPAIKRIIDKTQSMTVLKDTRKLASITIDNAIKLANKEDLAINAYVNNGTTNVPAIIIEPIIVDNKNVNDVIIKSGYYTLNQIYGA